MTQRHHETVVGPCEFLQALGESGFNDQRMIAHGGKRRRQILEYASAAMMYRAQPAVHRLGGIGDFGSMEQADALMTKANSEHGNVGVTNRVGADAEVLGAIGAAGSG